MKPRASIVRACPRAIAALVLGSLLLSPRTGRGESPLAPAGASEVEGRSAAPFLKRSNASFRAYAFRDGAAVPIPFQVDDRDHRNHWRNDAGPSPVGEETPGIFDDNDMIVFMNRDLGGRGNWAKLPADGAPWLEVRVGPESGAIGYAYLGTFASPPVLPRNLRDYSRYDPAADEVFGDRYTVRFGGPLPSSLGLVGRQGESVPNVLRGVRARGEARILAGLFHFIRDEKDLEYSMQGYRDGPVRAIRSAKYWIRLPLGFKARGKAELAFYGNYVEARARIKIKIPPRFVPADGEITAYFDFNDLSGARVLEPGGRMSEPIDGRMSESDRELAMREMPWAALLLPDGRTFLLAVRRGGSLSRLAQQLYFDDSDDPARGKPGFGFRLSGVNRLDTGEQELSVSAMVLDTEKPAEIERAVALLLKPPAVTVRRLK